MEWVITGDESWFFQYDPETKRQSLEWHSKGSPRPKKASLSKSKVKCMLVCFFDSTGIAHKEWVPAGQTDRQSILLQRHSWKTQKESHTGSSKHCHKLDLSPRQCASPCSVLCSAVFDIQRHYGDAAASLLTWSRALRLLISKSKFGNERTPFWIKRRRPEVCNAGLKRQSSSCIPGMLQTVAAPLENVYAGTRDVLWRWPYFSWWINKIKLFSGTSLITLLSDLVDQPHVFREMVKFSYYLC